MEGVHDNVWGCFGGVFLKTISPQEYHSLYSHLPVIIKICVHSSGHQTKIIRYFY
jgi:hypothetical protein